MFIPASIGVLLGALFVAVAQRLRVERFWYALGLVIAALIYVGFALVSAGHNRLSLELGGVVLYGAVALLGAWRWPWLLSIGWAGHGAWDVILHSGIRAAPATAWYPAACLGFDLVVALAYARRLTSRPGNMANEAQEMFRGAWARGIFPHQLSRLLDNPLRRVFLSPDDLADRLQLSETSRVLEVGPGSGYFSGALARRVPQGELVLLDVQPEMLAKARRKLESMGFDNVRYTSADASGGIPYPDGHFDLALLVSVLGEVSDKSACLRSLRRVLRVGGLLVVRESLPDPDMLKFAALVSLVQAEGFTFARRWGSSWNYTATFERANSDIEPPRVGFQRQHETHVA